MFSRILWVKMDFQTCKVHLLLRHISMLLFVSTALLLGLDSQTKTLFSLFERKATVKDLNALWLLTIVESVAAGYNLLQLINSYISACSNRNQVQSIKLAWLSLLLDQMVAYASFASTAAATQASFIAVTGVDSFQWMKMCNIYTRFCVQIGGGLLCGYVASLLMAVVTSFSAFHLFSFYSLNQFLVLKSTC